MRRAHTTAEDGAQGGYVALWTRADRFDPARGEFRHWFLHLAHNRIVDELRRRRRAALRSADKEPEDASLGLVSPGDTADQAVTAVMFGAAAEALQLLPPAQREAVVMAYLKGATQEELARRTGAPLGTVTTRLRLARTRPGPFPAAPCTQEARAARLGMRRSIPGSARTA